MERNLDRRIEVLVPVHDPELQARLLEILELVFADDTNSWVLGPDRRWRRVPTRRGINAQRRLRELAIDRARRRRDSTPAWTAPEPAASAPWPGERRGRSPGRLLGSPGEPAPALPGAAAEAQRQVGRPRPRGWAARS